MPERKYVAQSSYRYGFNGKENDIEVKGEDNQQDYGMRIYDPRVGRFLSVDPIASKFAYYSPYQYAGNKPVWCIDLDGLEDIPATGTSTPPPYSQQYFINWAKGDPMYKSPFSRNETVILRQTYYTIPQAHVGDPSYPSSKWHLVQKNITLHQGQFGKTIHYIDQYDATFTEDGYSVDSDGLKMSGGGQVTLDDNPEKYVTTFLKINNNKIDLSLEINFNSNSLTLSSEKEAIKTLEPLAKFLNSSKDISTTIGGNTDLTRPLTATNVVDGKEMPMSDFLKGRAEAIKKILVEKLNVDPNKIKTDVGTQGTTGASATATIKQ